MDWQSLVKNSESNDLKQKQLQKKQHEIDEKEAKRQKNLQKHASEAWSKLCARMLERASKGENSFTFDCSAWNNSFFKENTKVGGEDDDNDQQEQEENFFSAYYYEFYVGKHFDQFLADVPKSIDLSIIHEEKKKSVTLTWTAKNDSSFTEKEAFNIFSALVCHNRAYARDQEQAKNKQHEQFLQRAKISFENLKQRIQTASVAGANECSCSQDYFYLHRKWLYDEAQRDGVKLRVSYYRTNSIFDMSGEQFNIVWRRRNIFDDVLEPIADTLDIFNSYKNVLE